MYFKFLLVSTLLSLAPLASSFGTISMQAVSKPHPRKVVIVGGGIGGLSSAFDAKHMLRPIDEVTVVSERDHFQFTPSNPWVAIRKRTADDISLPLASILPRHKVKFVHGKAMGLDPKRQTLKLVDGTRLDYDFLIIATGPRLAFDEIPGAGPQKKSSCICTTPHASDSADAVDKLKENPGPIVIGATQGASCFGPAYEFAMLLHHELGKRGGKKLVEQCPITFLTSEPYIGHLGLSGAGDSQETLTQMLDERNIEWFANTKIDRVDSNGVHYTTIKDDGTRLKDVVCSKFNMLVPPFRGQHVWSHVPGLTDSDGLIRVDEHMQSVNYPTIFGVGTCVSLSPVEETPIPTGAPKTGYMIESMGTAAIKNIKALIAHEEQHEENRSLDGIELHSRPLLNGLCIADFGDDGAVFLAMPQIPPRRMDITIHGKIGTLAKIAFEKYFLYKIESGDTDPYYEKYMLKLIGIERSKEERDA